MKQTRSDDRLAACREWPKLPADQTLGVTYEKKMVSVKPLEDKKRAIMFSERQSGVFDVAPYIQSDFFKRLDDEAYFKQVRLFFAGIGWPEGQEPGARYDRGGVAGHIMVELQSSWS